MELISEFHHNVSLSLDRDSIELSVFTKREILDKATRKVAIANNTNLGSDRKSLDNCKYYIHNQLTTI